MASNQRQMLSAADGSSGSMPTPAAAVDFLMLLSKLKTTKRTGWVRCNVEQPESIADHMYRMGLMSLLASDCGVDAARCMKIALVHDVAESIVGDITPHCQVTDEEKYQLEANAVQQIKSMLGPDTTAALNITTVTGLESAGGGQVYERVVASSKVMQEEGNAWMFLWKCNEPGICWSKGGRL
eukprot:gene7888-8084_t